MKAKMTRILMLALVVSSVFGLSSVSAANSNGLGITPRKDYTLKAGQTVSDKLYINNLSRTQPLKVSLRLVEFSAQDETGTPKLDTSKNAPQTPWSIKPFIKLPKSVSVAPGKAVYVPFSVTIPKGQGAGSYYSAIQYDTQNDPQDKKVTIAASSASLLFVNVPGKATENLNLLKFGAYSPSPDHQTGEFGSVFVTGQPKELAYRVQNNGNVAERPSGSIALKNMFGKQVAVIQEVNPDKQLALRGQTRRFEVCMKRTAETANANGQEVTNQVCGSPGLMPGRYTAHMDVFYGLPGSSSREIMAAATFWYLPWWFLLIVLAIVALLVYVVMSLARRVSGRTQQKSKSRRR